MARPEPNDDGSAGAAQDGRFDLQTQIGARRSSPLAILRRFLSERKTLFFSVLGLRLFKDLLPFQGPILAGLAVDLLSGYDRSLYGYQFAAQSVNAIVIVAGTMVALAIVKAVVGYIHTMVSAHLGRHVVEAARRELADAAMQMALDERRRFNSGDLLDRCLSDSKGLRGFTQSVVIRIISNTVRAVYPVTLMFMMDPIMSLVVLAVIPIQSGSSAVLQWRLKRQTREARSREAIHTSAVKEAIDGWSSVASVGSQDFVASELRSTASASEDARIVKKRTTASIGAVINTFTSLGIAACYAIGGWRIIQSGVLSGETLAEDAFKVGTLVTFIGIAKKTYAPFKAYTSIIGSYREGIVNLERIADVLDAPIQDPRSDSPKLAISSGQFHLDDVHFSYDDDDDAILRGLTGTIPGHAMTVVTGSSGAGKTTLLRLLMGLDVPKKGAVYIDGQDINEVQLKSLRQSIALVPQEPMLFSGSLAENLTLGYAGATDEAMLDACHQAGLIPMVKALPRGLDTPVGSGRHILSGGQLRRMAIARALLRQPGILLLDEPTTGLDQEHSEQVLDTLRRISADTTVIMVSHRRDPLAASDHHLILRDGSWSSSEASDDGALKDGIGLSNLTSLGTADAPVGHRPAAATANGVRTNVTATRSNGARSRGERSATVGHQVIGLSAMGRPITLNAVDDSTATSRVVIVGGHRAYSAPVDGIPLEVFSSVLGDQNLGIALAAIETINPDGPWSEANHSALGVDLSNDHTERLSTEVRTLQDTIREWKAEVVIDVARVSPDSPDAPDTLVRVLYPTAGKADAMWVNTVVTEIERRLKGSRFSYLVTAVDADPGTLPNALQVPVIELSAVQSSAGPLSERSRAALLAASAAVCRAVEIPQTALAPT